MMAATSPNRAPRAAVMWLLVSLQVCAVFADTPCEQLSSGDCVLSASRCYYTITAGGMACKTFTSCEAIGSDTTACSLASSHACTLDSTFTRCRGSTPSPPILPSSCTGHNIAVCNSFDGCYVTVPLGSSSFVCKSFSSCASASGSIADCGFLMQKTNNCQWNLNDGGCTEVGSLPTPAPPTPAPLQVVRGVLKFGGSRSSWEIALSTDRTGLESTLKGAIASARPGLSADKVTIVGLQTGSLIVDFAIEEEVPAGSSMTADDVVASIVASNSTMSASMTTYFQQATGSSEEVGLVSASPAPAAQASESACGIGCIVGAAVGVVATIALVVCLAALVHLCFCRKQLNPSEAPPAGVEMGKVPHPSHRWPQVADSYQTTTTQLPA